MYYQPLGFPLVVRGYVLLQTGYGLCVPKAIEIAAGSTLEIGAGAILEIG